MTGTEQAWSRGVENGQTEMLWEERQMENDRSELRCGRKSHGRRGRKGGGGGGPSLDTEREGSWKRGFLWRSGQNNTGASENKRAEKGIIIRTR